MMKYILTLCSICQAAYISRIATVNRLRTPTVFRPGVTLQRPWNQPRLVQAASHRAPYVLYRNPPHRYAVKQYTPHRTVVNQWSTARLPQPAPSASEYEFVRAASAPQPMHTNGGAIHTIPAPNLSLSDKPIVVIDSSENVGNSNVASEAALLVENNLQSKPIYEVTEKYPESVYQTAKIEVPVAYSKESLTTPELQNHIRNGATFQLASEYDLSAINLPQSSIIPQQYAVQAYQGLPTQQQLINSGAEGIVIPPNALYESDPMFLQKLQSQLLQRFPAVEFIPYAADVPSIQAPNPPPEQQHQLFLLENAETRQEPSSFMPSIQHKNIVQREAQESSLIAHEEALIPQAFVVNNVTEKADVMKPPQPLNITLELLAAESQRVTTTIKEVIGNNTEEQNTTPIYYAQIGQNVGNVIANGFYSAINEVRAAAALAQVEEPQETTKSVEDSVTTTTPISLDLQARFVKNPNASSENQTESELKHLNGVPFAKPADSVNIGYTMDNEPKMTQEGAVYAGQIVQASISEDQDFNKEKATFMSRRAPIRLYAVSGKNDNVNAATNAAPKLAVVKAKIPPKSKLMFDDKTGEPVLRIYASYLDSPAQRETIASKLSSLKHVKEASARKNIVDSWKAATVTSVDKTQGFDRNQVTQFGLKLKSRSDDYIPLFEEYDE